VVKGISLIYTGVMVISIGIGIGLGFWSGARFEPAAPHAVQHSQEEREERKMRELLLTSGPLPAGQLQLQLHRRDEGWLVRINATIDDGLLITALQTARGLLHALARAKAPIQEVELALRTNAVRDVYGQVLSDLELARIVFTKATWDKVDWVGFDARNFALVADVYKLHPLLENQPLPPPRPDNAAMLGKQEDNEEDKE
jgi:hypothetical protein